MKNKHQFVSLLISVLILVSCNIATPTLPATPTPTPTLTPTITPTPTPTATPTPASTPTATPIPLVDIAPPGSIALAPGVSYYEEVLTPENIKDLNPYLSTFLEFYTQHIHYVFWDLEIFQGEFEVSERREMDNYPMTSETTLDFSNRLDLDIAINGGCFRPYKGLYIPYGVESACGSRGIKLAHYSEGDNIMPYGDPRFALFFSQDNQASFFAPIGEPYNAISGMNVLLRDGNVVKSGGNRHPRTAIGLSEDGRYMIWIIIEGRQYGHAEGFYEKEMGWLFKHLGMHNAINFDGGGSTTLVINGVIINHLPPQNKNIPRTVGTHMGAKFTP